MTFTLGHSQKAISIAIKHAWCHGLFEDGIPDSAPVDRKVLVAAREQIRTRGDTPIQTPESWSQVDTLEGYQSMYALIRQAANGLPVAVWELFAFNVNASAGMVTEVPTVDQIAERKRLFLISNRRAANPSSSPALIESNAQNDAVRSAFLQGTWPWFPPVSRMNPAELDLHRACESYVGHEAWRIAQEYSRHVELLTRTAFEGEIQRFKVDVYARFGQII